MVKWGSSACQSSADSYQIDIFLQAAKPFDGDPWHRLPKFPLPMADFPPLTAPPLPDAAESAPRLQGLPPVVGAGTLLLVLGSFPGVASLRAQQYYAHPQNQFWRLLQALWPQHPLPERTHYRARCDWLLARGLGLWDVYAACERVGSLDTRIRHAEVNDFAALRACCPRLAAIAHNGGESFKHAGSTASLGVPVCKLPSTSPAHASWSFERKQLAWAQALAAHGLL